MKVAVIQFPGSNCDRDTLQVLRNEMNLDTQLIWHNDFTTTSFDAVIIPGGFSFGDHLRAGIIAASSPATEIVRRMANDGKPVLGICNGFQILIEAGLLPGALLRNSSLKFVCKWMNLHIRNNDSAFTCKFEKESEARMPIAHNEGRFFAEEDVLNRLEAEDSIVMTYADENPTGTSRGITAVTNKDRNVVGMMPHPERASDLTLGGTDGLKVFESMVEWARC
ncbi:MAG TPA: phosphoribosylformylglycinamidine synthase subunit PurQ [Terriglobales bacterium]|nr:phosphoribosylformylglycinamidine synthase subunit PurQ [Terriglobales bacterium]